MNEVIRSVWEITIYYVKFYFSFFINYMNTSTIEKIDLRNFEVLVYSKGARNSIPYKLNEIIYDFALISSLSSEDASYIGYYYGCNYEKMNIDKRRSYNFLINPAKSNKYNVIAVDRRKNVIFCTNTNKHLENRSMKPEELLMSKTLLRGFHPTNACYIGLLAGINTKTTKKLCNF